MTLVQQYALSPDEIDRESMKMVQASLPRSLRLDSKEYYVLCRIVRAEGDSGIAESVRFSPGAVDSGLKALQSGANVITDVRMVEMGISRVLLSCQNLSTRCLIDAPEVARRAAQEGTTRSVAAVRELAPYMDGAIVAIGNAPTALLALLDLIDEKSVYPALVIGMPVGFVACAESKDELVKRKVSYITVLGRRGGSSAAAATVNALLDLLKAKNPVLTPGGPG
jgi:precorrin-8X/cobalt-precorrin-8 methylmutase